MDAKDYLETTIKQFQYYKSLGDKTFAQLSVEQLFWQSNTDNNSVGIIVNHLYGNMLSRWTDFLTTDGEKEWRNRDNEFDGNINERLEMVAKWESGWKCLFHAIEPLTEQDLSKTIYIRNMGHSVPAAINRQLAHYAYHVGQIVFLGKLMLDDKWQSLSIPKGDSKAYNDKKFSQPKHNEHFSDEFLDDK